MISEILKKYKTSDNWLGTRYTASLEAELVREIRKNGGTFDEFKKIVTFLKVTDYDDSATGLTPLYEVLNGVLIDALCDTEAEKRKSKRNRAWPWLQKNCFSNDFFLESLIELYPDEPFILQWIQKAEQDEVLERNLDYSQDEVLNKDADYPCAEDCAEFLSWCTHTPTMLTSSRFSTSL